MFSCFLVGLRSLCIPRDKISWDGAGFLEGVRAKRLKLCDQLLTETHFPLCATCRLSGWSLMEAGVSGWLQLYFVYLICFHFLKPVACTSLFRSLCGAGGLNLCREKHDDFYPVVHAGPTTLSCHCSVLFFFPQLFDHSFCGFVPLVIQDFLLRVYLESFAFSSPLLFELSTLGT